MQNNNNLNNNKIDSTTSARSVNGVTTTHVKVNIHDKEKGKVYVHERGFTSQNPPSASQSAAHTH